MEPPFRLTFEDVPENSYDDDNNEDEKTTNGHSNLPKSIIVDTFTSECRGPYIANTPKKYIVYLFVSFNINQTVLGIQFVSLQLKLKLFEPECNLV